MSIIKKHDKRSGITYVYESISYWDKEKKQPRSRRVLIGRIDEESGEIVPTNGRGKKRRPSVEKKIDTSPDEITDTVPEKIASRLFFGATYLFDEICKKLGITDDLKHVFLCINFISCIFHDFRRLFSIFSI